MSHRHRHGEVHSACVSYSGQEIDNSVDVTVYMVEITLDLRRIAEIELERDDLGNIRFSMEGRIDDDEKVEEVFRASQIQPVSLTVETEGEKDEADTTVK